MMLDQKNCLGRVRFNVPFVVLCALVIALDYMQTRVELWAPFFFFLAILCNSFTLTFIYWLSRTIKLHVNNHVFPLMDSGVSCLTKIKLDSFILMVFIYLLLLCTITIHIKWCLNIEWILCMHYITLSSQ